MTVAESFEMMPSRLNSNAASGMDKTFQWNITGDQAGVWAVKVHDGTAETIAGGVEKPDVSFTISDENWLSIAEGKLDPTSAFMSGKLKLQGDMMLAMKVATLFHTNS